MATPPDQTLRQALRRLGENGVRAEEFLDSAVEQLDGDGRRAPQHAAYAIREALMAIVKLGGDPLPGLGDAARGVVRRWQNGIRGEGLEKGLRRLADELDQRSRNERLLEQAVTGLARVAPTRGTSDLLDAFVTALKAVNDWLHADTPPDRDAVVALYDDVKVVLRDLFGPLSELLPAMDDLVGHSDPGAHEVAILNQRLGDERRLIYLFDRVQGPGWFRALRQDALLLPPPKDPWSAQPYIARVAEAHPDEVRDWLAHLPADLNAKQVGDALRMARIVKADVAGIVLRLARKHLASSDVRFQVDVLVRETPSDEHDTKDVRSLIRLLLRQTLGADPDSLDLYMAAEQLTIAIAATGGAHPDDWLTMLAHRTQEVADRNDPLRLRLIMPLSELELRATRRPLELVAAALVQAAAVSATAGLPLDTRLDRLRIVPEPLRERLMAQHLLDHLPAAADECRRFITAQVAVNDRPTPEELALLRRLFADGTPGLAAEVSKALGPPPPPETLDADPLPDEARRAHRWLVAVPEDAVPEWQATDARVQEKIGAAPKDGVLMRVGPASFSGPRSPMASEELIALAPLNAAVRVAGWRPEPGDSFFGPSDEGLAGTLSKAIDTDLDAWLAADPVEVAKVLRDPVYIGVFLQALTDRPAVAVKVTERIVALAELISSEPWPAEDLGGDWSPAEQSWARTRVEALKLLGRLAEREALPADVAERAWVLVTAAVRDRGDHNPHVDDQTRDPLSAATSRQSMRALDAAFAIGDADGVPDPRLLDLLDELLDLDGIDGLHSRAMMAVRLPWLHNKAPEWFAQREARVFGDAAPDALGPATLDLYLEWAQPYRALLPDERDRLVAALRRERHEEAVQQLLLGTLWQLPGFEPATIADILIDAGAGHVSYAGRWLGWGLADADTDAEAGADGLDLTPLVTLWRELLERRFEPEAYAGFGWAAVNGHIDDDTWLALTLDTATATAGALEEPDRVAERAGRTPTDPRAARIVAKLLAGDPTPWDLQRIGNAGLEILPQVNDKPAADDLRERLLERGFNDALDR